MTSQSRLAARFAAGADSGSASNMHIQRAANGNTQLVGYGWAVYAERDADTGRVTLYDGWRGYSVSTTQQLNKIRPHVDREVDARAEV